MNGTGAHLGPRVPMAFAAVVLAISLVASSCSSSPSIIEADASNATAPTTGAVEPVGFELIGERGGPTVPPTTVLPTSSRPEPRSSTTLSRSPGGAALAPAAPTTPAPVTVAPLAPLTTRPRPTTRAPRPQATSEPTNPATTALAAPSTQLTQPAAATGVGSAATAPPSVAPIVAPAIVPATPATTTQPKGPLVVAGALCRQSELGAERRTKDGVSVRCVDVGARRRWTAIATSVPTTSPTSQPVPAPGFDGATIRIGLLTTTTHPVWGTIGRAISAGIEARVAAINRRGGIAGRYPVIVVKGETNYDPAETLNQIQGTKAGVAVYVSLLGTPSTEAAEPVLRSDGMIASPASQEARWASTPSLLPVFNSYQVQAINGIAYFAEQFALTNPGLRPVVCGVSVATSFGDAGTEGIRAAGAALPVTLGPIVSVAPTDTSFGAAVAALKTGGCHATFLTVGPAQTLGIVLTGRQLTFATRWIIMGASFSDRIVTPQTGPLFEQGAWVVGDGTQWGDETVPGMVQLKEELLASDNRYWTENPDVGLSYGWAQARTIEQLLETAVARGDLSRVGIAAASQSMGAVDLGGIGSPIDYSQAIRLANAKTTVFNVDNSYRNAIRVLRRDYSSAAAVAYRR